jgi:hypothetical protein
MTSPLSSNLAPFPSLPTSCEPCPQNSFSDEERASLGSTVHELPLKDSFLDKKPAAIPNLVRRSLRTSLLNKPSSESSSSSSQANFPIVSTLNPRSFASEKELEQCAHVAIETFSKLYPPEIVEACGGVQKFDKLKTVDQKHLTGLYGSVSEEAVTDPIMIGTNSDQRAFIILTFDVYNFEGKKIVEKVSEIFHNVRWIYECDYKPETWKKIHNDPCYKWDPGIEKWQGVHQIYGDIRSCYTMSVLQIAERIRMLLYGNSVMEPHCFNYEDSFYIKLWENYSQERSAAANKESQCLAKERINTRFFNVVLDIDDVLMSLSTYQQWMLTKTSSAQIAAFYMRKGSILSARDITHYVFPGVIEFIQLLCQIEDVKLSFFSAAHSSRNKPLVASLLKRSLGDKKYDKIRDNILIFSENHCCFRKKKLSAILQGPIEDAALIDNDPRNRAENEESNFLYAPPTFTGSFSKLELKQEKYDNKGKTKIKCFVNPVFVKKSISVNWKGEILKIRFWHKELKKFQEIDIDKVTEIELYDLLKPYMESYNFQIPSNRAILDKLYKFVEKHGGQTEKICHRANRIYLITALLFRALNQARSSNASLSSFLPRIHTEWNLGVFEVIKNEWMTDDELYLEGLEKLRSINPSLEFIHPHNYLEAARAPLNEAGQSFISNARKNEAFSL